MDIYWICMESHGNLWPMYALLLRQATPKSQAASALQCSTAPPWCRDLRGPELDDGSTTEEHL